jgi:6-phosphogluconolactonase
LTVDTAATQVKVFPTLAALSQFAAGLFAESARASVVSRGTFLAALSGGGTPLGLYRLLASAPFRDELPWARMHFFWGDERCVPPDDPESNYQQAWQAFLSQVAISSENIHRVRGELEPAAAAADYTRQLAAIAPPGLEFPTLDLALLGLGEDGHTASLFPGSEVDASSPALAVSGHYQGRPADRVTLSSQVFSAARQVVFLVAGEGKARAAADAIEAHYEPIAHPAQRIRPQDGKLWWLLDQPAASLLRHN